MPPRAQRVTPAHLRALDGMQSALRLFRDLGYSAAAKPIDVRTLNLPVVSDASYVRSGSKRTGYGLVVGEASGLPRSLRPLARAIQREIHDKPLGVLGLRKGDTWERMVVFRPRRASGGRQGAVTVARLDIDLRHPTKHDAEVISQLQWLAGVSDAKAQDALADALDIEAVTKRFYNGLKPKFALLEAGVDAAAARSAAVRQGIDTAGGSRRVGIRLLTQILFCYFLQRKRLLAGDRDFLTAAYVNRAGNFYQTVLEPLFYDTLAVPQSDRKGGPATSPIPFLNGGLFERRYGEISLSLPDEVFSVDDGLLGYLDHWTFTVAEETADEVEVAVDPEMLGRIFESLLPDYEREKKGTYYTPRPVVQFMCREALVARLSTEDGLSEELLRDLVTEDDPLAVLRTEQSDREIEAWAEKLERSLESISVLDPAVGSGAFLLGMLGEILRLRGICYEARHERAAGEDLLHAWKLHAIERCLFGVDIEPAAIELCRLRLWLSLAVELGEDRPVQPLPNLEYRTLTADSLVDFVETEEIQNTRRSPGAQTSMHLAIDASEVVKLRARFFGASAPSEKARLRNQLFDAEDALLSDWLREAEKTLRTNTKAVQRLKEVHESLRSPDRVYPVFMPGFSAPDVWAREGWDIVIMNPPYVGRNKISVRYPPDAIDRLKRHFGDTRDLMILFGERALQFARPGGVMSMIFNDSIFTSADGDDFRRLLFEHTTVTVIARTKCFEGQAINGGVIVTRVEPPTVQPVRWVEGYRRPVADFAGASAVFETRPGIAASAGEMEVFVTPRAEYLKLPHRPLYRPSAPALALRDRFTTSAWWSDLGGWPNDKSKGRGWRLLSATGALEREIAERRKVGMYTKLHPGDWVMLGMVSESGVGLQTADDRRFLAAIEGTDEASQHIAFQERLENLTLASDFAPEFTSLLKTHGDREAALLALWAVHGGKRPCPLPWPRTGLFRLAMNKDVRSRPPTESEKKYGFASGPSWVPFEKGDKSQELEDEAGNTSTIGAAWARENPIVIDWSADSVALLRRRAATAGSQRPYFRNEHLWFSPGVTWNRVASFLRVRELPATAIFADMAPLLRPLSWVSWLSPRALLALLNSDVLDFVLRTFLGSRMHIELGDVRRLVIPVLSKEQKTDLETFAERAIEARQKNDRGLVAIEKELNDYVRDLYGVPRTADLWVVR